MTYRYCIDSILMSYRCIWISHRAYSKRISIHIGCLPVPCRFIYVVYRSYTDFISILYRFYIDVISMYMDFTSSVYQAHIDSDKLYISAMSIHIRRLYVVYRCHIDPVSILYGCHIAVYGFHIERI